MSLPIEFIKNKKNSNLIESFLDIISDYNITSLEELKSTEDKLFTINHHILNNNQRIEYCINLIKDNYIDIDNLDFQQALELTKLKNKLFKEKLSNKDEINILIRIYDLTNLECYFLVEIYDLLINNQY